MYKFARSLLFTFDAETAHDLGLKAIEAAYRTGLNPLIAQRIEPLPTKVLGIEFPNPVGLAAGMDKNGAYIDALAALGFGFIEIGTTTPKPQAGNPKPRMFRLPEAEAIINRLGFNNSGVDSLVRNADCARFSGPLGINIGKNKGTPNESAVQDYLICLRKVYARASYVTLNISSPNTLGLRDLQSQDFLRRLISTLISEREQLTTRHQKRVPLLVKIAPDLSLPELDYMARVFLDEHIDGVLCTNTTITRDAVKTFKHGNEHGGLSGRPLMTMATEILSNMAQRLGSAIPLIGVGGILNGDDAAAKFRAGASLVQFYTGLIYRGPSLIGECVEALRMQHNKP